MYTLTDLPVELLHQVFFHLPGREVAHLRSVHSRLNAVITTNEHTISRLMIQEATEDLAVFIDRHDFTGLNLVEGLRKYVRNWVTKDDAPRHGHWQLCHHFLPKYRAFHPLSPETRRYDINFVVLLMAADHWLQDREFSELMPVEKAGQVELREGLLDAEDETIPLTERYERLLSVFGLAWGSPAQRNSFVCIIEDMMRVPIAVRKVSELEGGLSESEAESDDEDYQEYDFEDDQEYVFSSSDQPLRMVAEFVGERSRGIYASELILHSRSLFGNPEHVRQLVDQSRAILAMEKRDTLAWADLLEFLRAQFAPVPE